MIAGIFEQIFIRNFDLKINDVISAHVSNTWSSAELTLPKPLLNGFFDELDGVAVIMDSMITDTIRYNIRDTIIH